MSERGIGKKILQFLKNFVTKNIGIKILALLFAVFLWAFVMADVNQERPKTISDVPISLSGTNDLLTRHLIVVGDQTSTADVVVYSNINNHAALDSSKVSCYASVATISQPGTYNLAVNTQIQNGLGQVESVLPQSITVEVDRLSTKRVPVKVIYEGKLPQGYEIISEEVPSFVTIEGASRFIEPAYRAQAKVSIDGMTEDFQGAVELSFFDKNNQPITVVTASGEKPTAAVMLGISAVRRGVPIEPVFSAYDETYIDVKYTMAVSSIDIMGDEAALSAIEALKTEPIVITADMLNTTITTYYSLALPDGIAVMSGQQKTIRITVEVTDKLGEKEIEIPITFKNKAHDLELSAATAREAKFTVKGKVKDIEALLIADFEAIADLKELTSGSFDIMVTAKYHGKLDIVLLVDSVKIKVNLIPLVN